MPDIGNTLREARIRRGLTLGDVENVTKIRSKYLEALEENDFEVLPGPTVVKGFLRAYAVFLKLDPELLLYEYRTDHETHRDEIGGQLRTEMAQQKRTPTSAERKKKRTRRTQRGYVTAAVIAVIAIVLIAYFSARAGGKGPATVSAENLPSTTSTSLVTTTTGAIGETSTTEGETTTTKGDTTTSTAGGTASTTGQNVSMTLAVTQGNCWLVVREDSETGRDLYAGALSAGGQQSFTTAKRYWVRAGAPENLSITVNGTQYTVDAGAGVFVITETGVQRETTDSTSTTG